MFIPGPKPQQGRYLVDRALGNWETSCINLPIWTTLAAVEVAEVTKLRPRVISGESRRLFPDADGMLRQVAWVGFVPREEQSSVFAGCTHNQTYLFLHTPHSQLSLPYVSHQLSSMTQTQRHPLFTLPSPASPGPICQSTHGLRVMVEDKRELKVQEAAITSYVI